MTPQNAAAPGTFARELNCQASEIRLPPEVLFIMGGLAAIAIFVARQLRLQRGGSPLMDLRTLLHATYA